MKKVILARLIVIAILFALNSFNSNAQISRCSTNEHEAMLQSKNPKRVHQRTAFEELVRNAPASANRTQMPTINIPVVVHVIYSNAAFNISDAQVLSQIEVLNEDFNRLNADSVNTPAAWQGVAAGVNFNFCMAQVDPNGAPTTGIERRQSTVTTFNTNDNIKSYATGGMDAWDPARYFNVWVGNLGAQLLGYAEFPTGALSNTYGVVIHSNYFGRIGSVSAPFNLGRTATHEVGHCFGLYHIWGDDGSACSGSDQVGDTPNQGGENYGCPGYPLTDNCSATAPGVMFMNYMDYTDDACMNMFTQGQATRMVNTFNSSPYNVLQNSNACGSANLLANNAGMSGIQSPSGNLCSGNITPAITIRNSGIDTLTTISIYYQIDNNSPLLYTWTGSLPSFSSANIVLPGMTTVVGSHTFTAYTSMPNGIADMDPSNDTLSVTFTVVGIGAALPFTEGFENGFPSNGISLDNPDGGYTWELSTAAAHSGTKSVLINNYDYSTGTGQNDDILLPNLNLTSATNPTLSFWVAYRLYTNPSSNPNYSDTLQVLLSTDCGATYTSLYKKFGTALVTTPAPSYTSASYVPIASHWRRDSISLSNFSSYDNVVVAFRNISDYENNLYIDDINLAGNTATGVSGNELASTVRLYPNPASDRINIDLSSVTSGNISLRIMDMAGRFISGTENLEGSSIYSFDIAILAAGSYVAELTTEKEMARFTFVKN